MSPKTGAERLLRDGTLDLAGRLPFARALVNGGRLSRPCSLSGMALQTPSAMAGGVRPGDACPDAPIEADGAPGWLLDHVGGPFTVLVFGETASDAEIDRLAEACPGARLVVVRQGDGIGPKVHGVTVLRDVAGLARARYGGADGTTCLIRPDAHVAAKFPRLSAATVAAALRRATGGADIPMKAVA